MVVNCNFLYIVSDNFLHNTDVFDLKYCVRYLYHTVSVSVQFKELCTFTYTCGCLWW